MDNQDTPKNQSMRRLTFTHQHRTAKLTPDQAQKFLQVTKRTIQNYYHPEKRQPHAWRLLEAHALGHLIPADLGIWYDKRTRQIKTDTGFSFELHELTQARHWATVQANTIQQLKIENSKLRAALEAKEKTTNNPPSNVIFSDRFKNQREKNNV